MQTKLKNQLISYKNHIRFSGLTIIFFVLLTGNCFGQSITWQRTYDGIDHASDGGFDVCKADGGNIYVCGYTTILPNFENIYLMKLNSMGDTIWTRTLDLGSNFGKIAIVVVPSGDDGCVITGDASFAFTLKYNSNGDIIWYKNYGGNFKQCYSMIKTSDGGYIACGRDGANTNEGAYVFKIDSLGNLQWQKTYFAGYWKTFYSVIERHDKNGFIISGFRYNYLQDTLKSIILGINSIGDSLWEKQYTESAVGIIYSIKELSNGYLIGGNNYSLQTGRKNFIGRINDIGDTANIRIISNNNLPEYFGEVEVINQNKYVIAASQDSSTDFNAHVLIVDSLGNVLADRTYRSQDFIFLRSVQPLPNGDIVFTGQVDFDPIQTREDIFALRTDSLLNAPPPIGIVPILTQIPKTSKLYQNYPNPFNPTTTINYELHKSDYVKLILYDVTGREISILVNESKNTGSYIYELSSQTLHLASGVYFVKILTKSGFTKTIKVILMK